MMICILVICIPVFEDTQLDDEWLMILQMCVLKEGPPGKLNWVPQSFFLSPLLSLHLLLYFFPFHFPACFPFFSLSLSF